MILLPELHGKAPAKLLICDLSLPPDPKLFRLETEEVGNLGI